MALAPSQLDLSLDAIGDILAEEIHVAGLDDGGQGEGEEPLPASSLDRPVLPRAQHLGDRLRPGLRKVSPGRGSPCLKHRTAGGIGVDDVPIAVGAYDGLGVLGGEPGQQLQFTPELFPLRDVLNDRDEPTLSVVIHLGDTKGHGERGSVAADGVKFAFNADDSCSAGPQVSLNVIVVLLTMRRRR